MQRNIFISGTKTVVFAPSVTGSVCLPKCGRFFGTVYNLETCRLKTVTQQGDSVTRPISSFSVAWKPSSPRPIHRLCLAWLGPDGLDLSHCTHMAPLPLSMSLVVWFYQFFSLAFPLLYSWYPNSIEYSFCTVSLISYSMPECCSLLFIFMSKIGPALLLLVYRFLIYPVFSFLFVMGLIYPVYSFLFVMDFYPVYVFYLFWV